MGDLKKARAALTRHQVDMRKMYAEKRIIMNINIDKLHCLIDLHVHLDGSVSIPMAKRLALINGIELNESEEDLKERLQVSKDCRDLNEYLEKYHANKTLSILYRANQALLSPPFCPNRYPFPCVTILNSNVR